MNDQHPLRDAMDDSSRVKTVMMWIFGVVVVLSGAAFFYKLYEFFYDLSSETGLRFAAAHLLTYVLVAGGFLLILTYAFLRGHFHDIEQPKYDLLEREREHDREEFGYAD